MNKWTSAFIGAVGGATLSAVLLYLFAPARDTTVDEKYQSRLDWALAEGEQAAQQREQELWLELEQARNPKSASYPIAGGGNLGEPAPNIESTSPAQNNN